MARNYDAEYERQMNAVKQEMINSLYSGQQNQGLGSSGLANVANAVTSLGGMSAAQLNWVLGQQTSVQPPFDPNENPAYKPTLQAVVDMWALRFGDNWVNIDAFPKEDSMWADIAQRIRDAGRMEQVHTRASSGNWHRLKDHHGNR